MKLVTILFISVLFLLISCNPNDSSGNEIQIEDEVSIQNKTEEPKAELASLGEKMFILCEACHSLKEGESHKTGPNLHQIFGSKAAIREDFIYSDALKSTTLVWDTENMRKWIEDPMKFIPNSNMAFVGVKKKEQQDALIEFLIEQTK